MFQAWKTFQQGISKHGTPSHDLRRTTRRRQSRSQENQELHKFLTTNCNAWLNANPEITANLYAVSDGQSEKLFKTKKIRGQCWKLLQRMHWTRRETLGSVHWTCQNFEEKMPKWIYEDSSYALHLLKIETNQVQYNANLTKTLGR